MCVTCSRALLWGGCLTACCVRLDGGGAGGGDYHPAMEIRGRAVLVTGASGGLGQAVVRRLRDAGGLVTVAGRRGEVLDRLAGAGGGRAVVADLASADGVRRLVEEAGEVDVLVSCAGVSGDGALGGFDVGGIDRVIDVNLRAPVLLARLFGEGMVERGAGHLVFVSALAGKAAAAGASLLSATQFGVRGFALALRQDWAPLGVGVSLVNVGPLGEGDVVEGVALPAGFRPRSVEDVAGAVVRAVRNDRAEVDVADPVKRAGVVFGQVAPQVAARLNRLSGTAGGW